MPYAYPFFERWVTGDHEEHHLCDRPRDKPVRTGLGVAAICFYAVLLLAGGNDILAHTFDVSLNLLTWIFRVSLVVPPPLAFVAAKRVCLALQEHNRERLTEGVETGQLHQTLAGGYAESHEPLDPEERHVLRARRQPEPPAPPPPGGPTGGPAAGDPQRVVLRRPGRRRQAGADAGVGAGSDCAAGSRGTGRPRRTGALSARARVLEDQSADPHGEQAEADQRQPQAVDDAERGPRRPAR
ncbi:hypothetical protein SGRIM128S_05100 [Streptomyces griseomycini]